MLNTTDDAVGVLRRLSPPVVPSVPNGGLRVNLHFAEDDWVTERPAAVLGFCADFLAELGRLADLPLIALPLIAYSDGRIDQRSAVKRVRAAVTERGIEVADPLVLTPDGLAEVVPDLLHASLTLSCSYHVALTSLMLEIPTVLISDNPYYTQKSAGLSEAFGLPPGFTPSVDTPS